jgi:3-oxoacyl-[acyl-carrier-protein] synthase III
MPNQNHSALPFAARITGTGSAFPEKIVTNDDLAKKVDTNDEWIRERTGIHQRRISAPGNPAEQNSSLGVAAAKRALEMAGKRPEDIDHIIYATCSPDTLVPSTSCWLQQKLGAKNASAMDVNAACSGFVYGMSVANQYASTGFGKTILVVGAEVLSPFVDWEDRGSCILFGDGAGAAIVESVPLESKSRILSAHLGSDGNLWELFNIPAGGSNIEVTPEVAATKLPKMKMKGREIFKEAVRTLADYAVIAIEQNGFKPGEIDWIIPHQANMRIIEAVAKRLSFPMERVIVNIERFGNTSAATVPTAMDEAIRSGRIKPGQLVLLDVFGAGLTYGSILLRW